MQIYLHNRLTVADYGHYARDAQPEAEADADIDAVLDAVYAIKEKRGYGKYSNYGSYNYKTYKSE